MTLTLTLAIGGCLYFFSLRRTESGAKGSAHSTRGRLKDSGGGGMSGVEERYDVMGKDVGNPGATVGLGGLSGGRACSFCHVATMPLQQLPCASGMPTTG